MKSEPHYLSLSLYPHHVLSLDASDCEQDNILWSSLAVAMSFLHSERSGEAFDSQLSIVLEYCGECEGACSMCIYSLSLLLSFSLCYISLFLHVLFLVSLIRLADRVSISTCTHHVHISGERNT